MCKRVSGTRPERGTTGLLMRGSSVANKALVAEKVSGTRTERGTAETSQEASVGQFLGYDSGNQGGQC